MTWVVTGTLHGFGNKLAVRHCERSVAIFDRKVGDKRVEDCHVAITPRNDGG